MTAFWGLGGIGLHFGLGLDGAERTLLGRESRSRGIERCKMQDEEGGRGVDRVIAGLAPFVAVAILPLHLLSI
jgi:hypothetical protein